jgi:hypothetical protein
MEVMLTLAQQEGKEFCAGLPLVPTLDDVSCWLATECRLDAAAPGVPPHRERATLRDGPGDGDTTFFLGKRGGDAPSSRLHDQGHECSWLLPIHTV